jgi:hypothetical protein
MVICTGKKTNEKLYMGEWSGARSLKYKNSGIFSFKFASSHKHFPEISR